MISFPETASLLPEVRTFADGSKVYVMPSESTELVKLDLLHEAGSAYQPQLLCAAAANRLYSLASSMMSAAEVAEFMDYRGIIVEHGPDILCCRTSFYFLRRYFDELLPVLCGLLAKPAFPQEDFDAFRDKRRQELQEKQLKSDEVARRMFYEALFGAEHPLGRSAEPGDADRLLRDVVASFFAERYSEMQVVVAGNVDDGLVEGLHTLPGITGSFNLASIPSLATQLPALPANRLIKTLPSAVQTTVRVGRVLPLRWDDPDYARLMLAVTMLGGYFGSRLMSNLREDKGYTYGVSARTQIFRGVIVFFVTANVAAGSAEAAEVEIRRELRRLCDEPVGDDELQLVRNVMAGDFIRSVDGIFERSERLCSMMATGVDERLTDNLRAVLQSITPEDLQRVSRRWLDPDTMLYCFAGA